MTLEDLKRYREKMKKMTDTMQKDCQYIEEDIQKSKDILLFNEKNFCDKMHEYETLMPTVHDILKIKSIYNVYSYFFNTNDKYKAPVVGDTKLNVKLYGFTEYGAKIVINIYHTPATGSSYNQYMSQVVVDSVKKELMLMYDNWHDAERESAKVAVLKNQDKIFDMMGQLVLKINDRYAEILRKYNEDLLADTSEYINK